MIQVCRAVLIEWDDTSSHQYKSWFDLEEVEGIHGDPTPMFTVGWLLKKDRKAVTIATTVAAQGSIATPWRIPAGCVKKMTFIKGVKPLILRKETR